MEGLKIGIVGCHGRMGAMLGERWKSLGYKVSGTDQPLDPKEIAQVCHNTAVVFLCVPAAVLDKVLQQVLPFLDPVTILADITSVKMLPMQIMERIFPGPVVGTHPLFGPHTTKPLPLCVVPGEKANEEHINLVETLFLDFGCTVFRNTAQGHDQAMAAIQGLNFITSAAYFALFSQHPEYEPFFTPSFQRRLDAAHSMLTEDGPLFTGLFEANPMSHEAVRQYRAFLNMGAGGDVSLLAALANKMFNSQKP